MTAPIIVPDDDSTAEVIRDAILRATGYSPVTADVILRALRLHSDHHGVGPRHARPPRRDGGRPVTTATVIGRAFGILLTALFAPALAGVLTRCGR